MKPLETISKANTHYDDITYESMAEFIEENRHPSVHHLTSAQALHTVFSLNRPVVIFHDVTRLKDSTNFAKLASNYSGKRTVAAFAVNQGLSMIGLFLADTLNIDISSPLYILVNAKEKCIYKKLVTDENEAEIEHWVKTAANGDCIKAALDLNTLAALRDWERRDELRRAVEQKLSMSKHEEL
ncbi:hypothetical protein OESDEN_12337 [Oesophagostomum dentatum]|uniref:Uncharacterized protein n=1 Tax=Oesophagostomum dentatum TaxID=61180 RepID=A0A0B1SWH2_OESDE|nr:hypothetical protein OESDEN_12337 [Oesophagostomum dentatum]